ncbi:MAG: aldo/keto reductase [Bacteriovoracaceae bacterium]|nr:aldo/keto reductase [Bacteriovoracaceae bacterium]
MGKLLENISNIPLGFGGAAISGEGGGYGFGQISEDDAIGLLNTAKDMGVKLFDTAPIYGFGVSEKRMGKAFAKNRDEVFLVSKSGVSWHENKRVNMTNDPKETQKMLEQSLRDLQSDYIDLYMIHWPDEKVDIRKPMEVLSKAKEQGKIKHIGLCNTFEEDLNKAFEIDRVEAVQCQLNLFEQEVVERLFPYLDDKEISFMSWGTLDKGILSKRVDESRTYDKEDCRSWAPWWKQMDNKPKFEKLKRIWPLIEEYGHTPIELAIGYNLSNESCSMVLCGARNDQQLEGVVNATSNRPSDDVMKKVMEIILED